jgi:hypothetical protein
MRVLEFICREDGENYLLYTGAGGIHTSNKSMGAGLSEIKLHFSIAIFGRLVETKEIENALYSLLNPMNRFHDETRLFEKKEPCFIKFGVSPDLIEIHLSGNLGITIKEINEYATYLRRDMQVFPADKF